MFSIVLEDSQEIINSLTFTRRTYIICSSGMWKAGMQVLARTEAGEGAESVLRGVLSASPSQCCAEESPEFDTHLTLATSYVPLGKFLFFSHLLEVGLG